ncbi:hypothetical protein AVEN_108935-1 [Araneus ventricosus]|uniref:Uncharacterized protein n=1 Tax=Araneus ventricosus TaxID=182803 RepID=A0A4Y2EP13_ARAVE|nr:hypothetical protein AVEN_108935-1 [Araneus ventricosus]
MDMGQDRQIGMGATFCLMPLRQPDRLDGYGTGPRHRTPPYACCHYGNRTGWMDMGHRPTDRTPPHVPVPDAMTASVPVEWTWDKTDRQTLTYFVQI